MQQMQEPEGRSYNSGYPESAEYPRYQDNEQTEWSQPQYAGQQKLQPEGEVKLSKINSVMAILSVIASSFIMGLSIALTTLTTEMLVKAGGPNYTTSIVIASFVISLILLLCSIAGFVFSTIQLALIQKKLKHAKGTARSWRG